MRCRERRRKAQFAPCLDSVTLLSDSRVRERLGLSQAVFASLLGASVSTVRAWERGAREPSEIARRLLEVAERQPEVFEEVIVSSK